MMNKWKALILCLACSGMLPAQPPAKEKIPGPHRINIIFDSDMGPDYDDVGAITLLHAFADQGKLNILATIASTRYENVAAVFSVLDNYFHRSEIPIAVPKKNGLLLRDWQHWTDTLVTNYPHSIKSNPEVPEPVQLYRKMLATHPDKSITIVTVGFLTNLAALLKSGPDRYSKLSGYELVKKKVKRLVSMGGRFPSGDEFNIDRDAASSAYTYDHWPTEVWFSGFEIGEKIKTGLPLIRNESIQHSPVKDVFRICMPMAAEDSSGRKSWDETAVLVAATGYQPYFNLKKGRIKIAADGSNTWDDLAAGQFYLVEKQDPAKLEQLINRLIQHQPQQRRRINNFYFSLSPLSTRQSAPRK